MQRPRHGGDGDEPDPISSRDVYAVLVGGLGLVLTFVMAVIVVSAMPWHGGLLLAGVVCTAAGALLGTRRD
jgi:hypothetical protein